MTRRLLLVLVIGFVIGAVFGGAPVASGDIYQCKLVAAKEAAGKTNASLQGTYHFRMLGLINLEAPDRQELVIRGSMTFDGAGSWTVTQQDMFWSDGSSESITASGTYSVASDGSFTLLVTSVTPNQTWTGNISSDDSMCIMTRGEVDAEGDTQQCILTAVKDTARQFSDADLNGKWRSRAFELHHADGNVSVGTLTFDGQGGSVVSYTSFWSDGTLESGTETATYTVHTDGSVDFSVVTTSPVIGLTGNLSSDGETLISSLGEEVSGTIQQWLSTAVKEDPTKTFTDADLSGTYRYRWLRLEDFETDDREAQVNYGSVSFDGAGSWTGTGNSFDSDGESGSGSVYGTYSVKSDGSFVFAVTSLSPNETWTGDISSDGELITMSRAESVENGYLVAQDLWIRAVINTVEKGPIDAVWQKGGEDTTSRGDRVIWGHFYASPSDVTWGSQNNPDLFVKIWFDVSGRVDVNFFHVSVPDIEVYSDYPHDGTPDEHGTTTMSRRYIRQYYESGQSYSDENYEDGAPPAGYSPAGNPSGYSTINDLRIGSIINTVEKGAIDAVWRLGGQDTTSRGDQVVWGHFYASPSNVTWGSQDNPDLFVKIWFDVSGRVDVNFFHVSVPYIEVYSDLPDKDSYDQKETTIMDNRYIRHEYWR